MNYNTNDLNSKIDLNKKTNSKEKNEYNTYYNKYFIKKKITYEKGASKKTIFIVISILLACLVAFTVTILLILTKIKNNVNIGNSTSSSNNSELNTSSENGDNIISNKSGTSNYIEGIKKESIRYNSIDKSNSEIVLKSALETLSSGDFDEFNNYINTNESLNFDEIKSFLSKTDESIVRYSEFYNHALTYDYKITEINEESENATAKIKITTYDYTYVVMDARLHITDSQLTSKYSGENGSKEKIAHEELTKIFSNMPYDLEKDIEVKLVKENGQWKIDQNSVDRELYGSIMGNLQQACSYYLEFYKQPDFNEISLSAFKEFVEKQKNK